jgi:hypothetical protein
MSGPYASTCRLDTFTMAEVAASGSYLRPHGCGCMECQRPDAGTFERVLFLDEGPGEVVDATPAEVRDWFAAWCRGGT